MSAEIPQSHRDLLEKPVYVVLTTLMPNGDPQASVVWCSFDGTHVWINTIRGRRKEKNMTARPVVSIVAMDPQNPLRYLEVRGTVAEATEEGAVEHINRLANLYLNKDFYGEYTSAERAKQETRVIFKIKPTHVVTYGH